MYVPDEEFLSHYKELMDLLSHLKDLEMDDPERAVDKYRSLYLFLDSVHTDTEGLVDEVKNEVNKRYKDMCRHLVYKFIQDAKDSFDESDLHHAKFYIEKAKEYYEELIDFNRSPHYDPSNRIKKYIEDLETLVKLEEDIRRLTNI